MLRPYFTNLDGPVFALVNLPEVVKGALFAAVLALRQEPAAPLPRRVRRRPRPHRRPHRRRDRRAATRRGALRPGVPRVRRRLRRPARRRAPRVRAGVEPAHEDPRVGPPHGVPRAVDALHPVRQPPRRSLPVLPADPEVLESPLGARYVADLDVLFDTYARLLPDAAWTGRARATRRSPATPTSSTSRRSRPRRATPLRGILPAATLSNVGIYGTGQAFEALLLRMRAHPLPEARQYAAMMLDRAAQGHPVVPDPRRPPRPRRRVDRVPRRDTRTTTAERRRPGLRRRGARAPPGGRPHRLRSRRRGQAPRRDAATRTRTCPRTRSWRGCGACSADERVALLRAYVGERTNRRHKPGRAFERTDYRFDVLADYGAFRDLQRHRMLTIEWQPLSPAARLRRARGGRRGGPGASAFDEAMAVSAAPPRRAGAPLPRAGVVRGVARVPRPLRRCR